MEISDNKKNSYYVFQDWKANHKNISGRLIMVFFRIAQWVITKTIFKVLFFWYLILYNIFIQWISNIHISLKAKIGVGLRLESGRGTYVDSTAILGHNCTIRHLTTIAKKKLVDNTMSKSPRIGNYVDFGVNAIIIGDIKIGNNVVIGAGSVITKNVSDNSVMAGNPAKLLKKVYDYPGLEHNDKKITEVDTPISLLDQI